MVVGLVLIGTIGTMVNKWIAAKHGYEIDEDGEKMVKIVKDDPKTLARIDALEKRVRVLERIATDDGARLASEIEALKQERYDDLSDALSRPEFTKERG